MHKIYLSKRILVPLVCVAIIFFTQLGYASNDYRSRMAGVDVSTVMKQPGVPSFDLLPTGEEWIVHVKEDILPFWTTQVALGNPTGNFPTFLANNGSLIDIKNPPEEVKDINPKEKWLLNRLDRQYPRMISRQIFAYCIAFQLTGEEKYLKYAKAGLDYLLTKTIDKNGHFYSWFKDGKGYPENDKQRISQDIAYDLMGPAAYYYLTRDPEVLSVLLKNKKYIFDNYKEGNYLRWINEDFTDMEEKHFVGQKELVSQLDQINAYMLLVTPLLEPKYQKEWLRDMLMLARTIKNDYYSPQYNLFWGCIDREECKKLGLSHVDFGHTIKTLWIMFTIGNRFNDTEFELRDFALIHMPQVFQEAYDPTLNTWIETKLDDKMGLNRIWWAHCELDQSAATLSLIDPFYVKYLVPAYKYWFFSFVDRKNHEVWHGIDANTNKPMFLKAHLWKNAFHDMEHALVGYITSEAIRKEPVTLYFAFVKKPEDKMIQPYTFSGNIKKITVTNLKEFPNFKRYAVTFDNINP